MKPTLVILAAGMGSRYGGLKQIDPIGQNGEILLEYAAYDALQSGFGKLVFVIRKDIEAPFRQVIGNRLEQHIEVEYAFQALDDLPAGCLCPNDRAKPWGTGQAVLAARSLVNEPFGVINADDFYGPDSFRVLGDYLSTKSVPAPSGSAEPVEYCMVGFVLAETLSPHGTVSRGICQTDREGYLCSIAEHTAIAPVSGGAEGLNPDGVKVPLTGDETVSMNFWGFDPSLFGMLESEFAQFLQQHGADPTAEFYLPAALDHSIHTGLSKVRVLVSREEWFGVTHRADRERAQQRIVELTTTGRYPQHLWG